MIAMLDVILAARRESVRKLARSSPDGSTAARHDQRGRTHLQVARPCAPAASPRARRLDAAAPGDRTRGDVLGPGDLAHGPVAAGPWDRRQRLALPRHP